MARKTYKYHFKKGKETLYSGITKDLEKREQEHKRDLGGTGHIKKVGRKTTHDGALKWERGQTKMGKPTRKSR